MDEVAKTEPVQILVLLNRDLMTGIAVNNAAKALGLQPRRVGTTSALLDLLNESAPAISLAVIDMGAEVDWDEIGAFITTTDGLPPIIGFGPHVDVEGRRAAKQAGLTRIYSNGEFHQNMGHILERYARQPDNSPEQ